MVSHESLKDIERKGSDGYKSIPSSLISVKGVEWQLRTFVYFALELSSENALLNFMCFDMVVILYLEVIDT